MSAIRSLFVLLILVVASPVVFFTQQANQQAQSQAVNQNLQLHTIQRGDVQVVVTAIGAIEANEVVNLNFTSPGRVTDVYVQQGDVVLAGDPLAQQRNETQRIAYEQAELAVELARLRLQDLLQPVDEADVRIAQANLDSAWGAYNAIANSASEEDIRAAELQYEQALAALEAAREVRVDADGGLPEEQYTLLDAQVGQASFSAEIARLQLEQLREGNGPQLSAAYGRVLQAQRDLERVQAGPTDTQIEQAEASVRQAEIQRDQSADALERTMLLAPFDGIVSGLNIEVGSLVTPGLPVFEMTRVSPLELTVQVDEVDIRQISDGMNAFVQIDALPTVRLPATIEQVSLVGQNDGGIVSYDVQMVLDEEDPRVRVGMTAEAIITVQERRDVLVVPNFFVRLDRRADQAFVNVLRTDDTIEEIEVQLGLQGQETSEIVSGLSDGDVVVIDLSGEGLGALFGE